MADANSVAIYELDNAITDSSGNGHTLLNDASPVPFVTSPAPPDGSSHWAGPYLTNQFYTLPPSFDSVYEGLTTWTVEGYIRANSIANTPNIFTFHESDTRYVIIEITATGALRIATDNGFTDSAAGLVAINTDYYLALSFDGTTIRAYVSPALNIDSVVDASRVDTSGAIPNTLAGGAEIGRWERSPFFNPFNGYIDAVQYSDIRRLTFPTGAGAAGAALLDARRGRR